MKVKVKSLSRVWLFATPWTAAHQAPLSMGFSRQEYWNGLPLPSPSDSLKWYQFILNIYIYDRCLLVTVYLVTDKRNPLKIKWEKKQDGNHHETTRIKSKLCFGTRPLTPSEMPSTRPLCSALYTSFIHLQLSLSPSDNHKGKIRWPEDT